MKVIFKRDFGYIPAEGKPRRTIPQGTVGEVLRTIDRQSCLCVQVEGEPYPVFARLSEVETLEGRVD